MQDKFYDELIEVQGTIVKSDYSLTSTIDISARFKYLVEIYSVSALKSVFEIIKKYNKKYYVLGEASNVLFVKDYYDGVLIKTCVDFKDRNIESASKRVGNINQEYIKEGISSLLFLVMVPCSVGGAIYMNASSMGKEIKDIVRRVYFYDIDKGCIRSFSCEQCEFGYRDSYFRHHNVVILGAKFKKEYMDKDEIRKEYKKIVNERINKLPYTLPNLGSVFKNFSDVSVGKLIDDLGLKGLSCGGVKVSEKHANVIVNVGDGRGEEVLALIEEVKRRVYMEYKRELELEIITFE